MEYVIIIAIIIAYSSLSSKINKISNKLTNNSKKIKKFQELIGKNVVVSLDGDYILESKGTFKNYDNTWIEIETINKKNKKETCFYKINNIKSITHDINK